MIYVILIYLFIVSKIGGLTTTLQQMKDETL